MEKVSPRLVRSLLAYNSRTGDCRWKDHPARRVKGGRSDIVGKLAGNFDNRYWRITINGKGYLRARVAWCIMTGRWPVHEIDHINRNKVDDRWVNLRQVSSSNQNRNIIWPRRVYLDLPQGVQPSRNKTGWIARWVKNKIRRESKTFYTIEEAAIFRETKLKELNLDQYSPKHGG